MQPGPLQPNERLHRLWVCSELLPYHGDLECGPCLTTKTDSVAQLISCASQTEISRASFKPDFVRSSSGKSKAPSSPPFASSLQGSGTKPPKDCCLLPHPIGHIVKCLPPCCFVPHTAEKRKASTAFAQIGSSAASPQGVRDPSKLWKR